MFTVCPKCALTLVVTAADLRVAQGYVRCGRCSSVFNALARLTERQAAEAAEGSRAAEAGAAQLPAGPPGDADDAAPPAPAGPLHEPPEHADAALHELPEENVIPEAALEFDPATTDVNAVFVAAPPNPQWTAATGSFRQLVPGNAAAAFAQSDESQVDVEIDAAFLASMLRTEAHAPAAPVTAAPTVPEPAATAAAKASSAVPLDAAQRARIVDEASATASASMPRPLTAPGRKPRGAPAAAPRLRSLTEDEAIQEAEALALDDEPVAGAHPLARFLPNAWPAGAALAVVVLAAQVVNHYRDELAASARFNHPLTALYGSFGVHLFPHWDLRAYDVRQLGASGDPAGAGLITVRASIKNGASQPQPLPLLRVTLQDRFGNRIAARDVAPRSYLPSAMPASSFLSAGQRIDAQMGFADPGPNAVGFEIDACLPARGGITACANDAPLR